jgi:hypothetical protein
VIVHAHVRQVRRHALERARPAEIQELTLACGVELQQRRSELEALRPLGPAARAVAPLDSEHRRTVAGVPGALDRADLGGGQLEQAFDPRQEIARSTGAVDLDHGRTAP